MSPRRRGSAGGDGLRAALIFLLQIKGLNPSGEKSSLFSRAGACVKELITGAGLIFQGRSLHSSSQSPACFAKPLLPLRREAGAPGGKPVPGTAM